MSNLPGSVCFYCADQNPDRDRSRGITRYTSGLLSSLRDFGQMGLAAVVSKSSFAVPNDIVQRCLPFRTDHVIGRLAADHLHPLLAHRDLAEIWHYPKGFLPIGLQVRAKKVGTIADVILQHDADHHPETRPRLAWIYWIGLLKHSIRNLDLIITVSEFSKNAIRTFCDRYGLKCPPIVVAYQGVTVEKTDGASEAKEDYVVHLASNNPSKGTRWLLEQWEILSQARKDSPHLRLIGDLDSRAAALLDRLSNVSLTPSLPGVELEMTIAKARALLMPSEIEGFGIPAVESFLLGTPVAYSKDTALEEIIGAGSRGGFERDTDSFLSALEEALGMENGTVQQKAAQLKERYNWEDCVHQTLEAYRMVAAS